MAVYKARFMFGFHYDTVTTMATKLKMGCKITNQTTNISKEIIRDTDIQNLLKLVLSSYTGNTNPPPTSITLSSAARTRLTSLLTEYNI